MESSAVVSAPYKESYYFSSSVVIITSPATERGGHSRTHRVVGVDIPALCLYTCIIYQEPLPSESTGLSPFEIHSTMYIYMYIHTYMYCTCTCAYTLYQHTVVHVLYMYMLQTCSNTYM